jgi:uncharacterized RDD family membrane protein YckC
MTYPVCGKTSPCAHILQSDSTFLDQDYVDDQQSVTAVPENVLRAAVGSTLSSSDDAWRQEVTSRVQQHRARRRRPMDPKAMELEFPAEGLHSFEREAPTYEPVPPPPQRFAEIVIKPEPKIIRFPRTQPTYVPTVEEVTLEELELAEPLPETLRITHEPDIEVAEDEPWQSLPVSARQVEQMELLPSFADMQLESEETRSNLDSEIIPRPAPLNQRFISGLLDAGIVLLASMAFVVTFLGLAEEMPRSRAMFGCALAVSGILWILFQYMFLVYKRATPGMRLAQLELCTFKGRSTTRFARQYRALASVLSSFSLGLGYAWALVDEDRLGWHDRISQTHLRSYAHAGITWQNF